MGAVDRDHAIAAGFEEEGSDGEDLFIVIDAEDRFFRAHNFSVLPGDIADRLQNRVGRCSLTEGPDLRGCWLARA